MRLGGPQKKFQANAACDEASSTCARRSSGGKAAGRRARAALVDATQTRRARATPRVKRAASLGRRNRQGRRARRTVPFGHQSTCRIRDRGTHGATGHMRHVERFHSESRCARTLCAVLGWCWVATRAAPTRLGQHSRNRLAIVGPARPSRLDACCTLYRAARSTAERDRESRARGLLAKAEVR